MKYSDVLFNDIGFNIRGLITMSHMRVYVKRVQFSPLLTINAIKNWNKHFITIGKYVIKNNYSIY